MKLIYTWIPAYCRPPRWMAFSHYSAERNQSLFVIPPLNLLIACLWWLQDKWAYHAQATSWIEEELRRRNQQRPFRP